MGFLAPAVPWIAKGASLLGGFLGGKKAQSSAMQRSPEEAASLTGAAGSAGDLTRSGTGMLRGGMNLLQTGQQTQAPATSYYSTLLRGNRAAQSQAVAAPRAAISDVYGGAEKGLEKSGLRGASRDVAAGELQREKAGKISSLITGVQPGAANALANIGGEQTAQGINFAGQGANAFANSGSIYSNLLGQGFQNRAYGRQEGERASQPIGGFLFDILSGTLGKKFGKGGGVAGGAGASSATAANPGDFGSDEWYTH